MLKNILILRKIKEVKVRIKPLIIKIFNFLKESPDKIILKYKRKNANNINKKILLAQFSTEGKKKE